MSEESARKARIRRLIREKQSLINTCERELSTLEKQQRKQQTSLDHWLFQETLKMNIPIMDEVVMPKLNQGTAAEQIRVPFFENFQKMVLIKQELNDELSDLQRQINQVRDYISQLESEISDLRNRL